MNVSDRDVCLRDFFPFIRCTEEFCEKAFGLGKCVKYSMGEPVLLNGSPAKHCGIIVSGQAVAFKLDGNGKRYQLCLDEGCFIGLETLRENSSYNAKIAAVSELEVFFWNRDGLRQLTESSPEFAGGMRMLNEGRIYQEKWLIPETDITDPVLCSLPAHWLSVISPAFMILPVFFIFLWACALMVRRYPVAWLLIIGLFAGAGNLLYRQIVRRSGERLIITSKNVIHVPMEGDDLSVIRLYTLDSITVRQNIAERIINAGKMKLQTDVRTLQTPLLRDPLRTAALIRNYAERAALGRKIPIRAGREIVVRLSAQDPEEAARKTVNNSGPKFRTIEFHAHWALLVKMIIKPVLLLILAGMGAHYFRSNPQGVTIWKIMILLAAGSLAGIGYQIFTWRNNRFFIEEDCVKDYSYSPLTREDQNIAMNHKIQSVRFTKQGFFQNLLNYGTVYILAGEGELKFTYISDPKRVQQQIKDTCMLYESKHLRSEDVPQRGYGDDLAAELRRENEG